MSPRRAWRVGLVLVAPLALQACATRGFVRREIAALRAANDSALVAEQNARTAADNAVAASIAARLAALRTDLDSLRTQFDVRVVAMENGLRFVLPVTFAYNDATVSGDARPMLERFARVVSRYYPTSTITIEGFADPAGSASYNLALSKRRADNVRAQLASLGLGSNPLRAIGYGETRLVVPSAAKDDVGAKSNRRVAFVIENVGPEAAVALGPSR
jgi:outer membrane protein OmpA-like peptidoglycan-associated protein